MDSIFAILGGLQKILYPPLYKLGKVRYVPEIASLPFKNSAMVYKKSKKIGRVSIFAGCSINYFYPHLGDALLKILLTGGYEVVVLKGEVCCGAPLRALGFEKETVSCAEKNIELFNKMNVEAILSMCPTCTMTIRNQYPLLTGSTIQKIMDVNEFLAKSNIVQNLKPLQKIVTYHDPCHLRYGIGIKNEPREILKSIQGIDLVEMRDSEMCCGFGGFFSMDFKELSKNIGAKKLNNACSTSADTIVTSCPGCMMQLEDIRKNSGVKIDIKHIVEIVDEALCG